MKNRKEKTSLFTTSLVFLPSLSVSSGLTHPRPLSVPSQTSHFLSLSQALYPLSRAKLNMLEDTGCLE
jgi:hypothetical protein